MAGPPRPGGGHARADAYKIAADFVGRYSDDPIAMLSKWVVHYSALALARVKANAATGTHRPGEPHIPGTGPGPNRATGDYTRTMHKRTTHRADSVTSEIGTNAAQARRLEFGYYGTDSLGRTYHQDPFPHWQPMRLWLETEAVWKLREQMSAYFRRLG